MTEIKTPVTYRISDHSRSAFTTFYDGDYKEISPEQIVAALNATRREDALVEALEHYANEFNYDPVDFSYRPDVVGQKIYDVARKALKAYKGDKSDES